jgi:hypothetical protein
VQVTWARVESGLSSLQTEALVPKAVLLAVVIALGLGACRDYERVAYRAHERFERSHLSMEGETRPVRATRARARGRSARAQRRSAQRPGRFRLHPKTPYVGSAEWKQEQAQDARREAELARKIKGICSRC